MKPTSILSKTPHGKEVLSQQDNNLHRTERNLLVLADGNRTAAELLGMVSNSSAIMLENLVANNILEVTGEGTPEEAVAIGAPLGIPELDLPLSTLVQDSPFGRLYAFLLVQIPYFFGVSAFLSVLKVEKANTLADLEPIQKKLLEAVAKERGSVAAQAYQQRMEELVQP